MLTHERVCCCACVVPYVESYNSSNMHKILTLSPVKVATAKKDPNPVMMVVGMKPAYLELILVNSENG